MAKYFYLILTAILFTSWLYLLHLYAPSLDGDKKNDADESAGEIKFPNNLKELKEVALILQVYSVKHWWYVLIIFSCAYVYKQAFCIPGSIFLNLLAGALYGSLGGLLLACLFTAIGASVCYSISQTFAKDLIQYYFSERVTSLQEKIKKNEDNLIYFMLLLRLVPITPGWMINVIAPLLDVPIFIFFITTFFGLGPYNFIGVSAGSTLASLESIDDVFTWKVLINISLIGLAVVCPAYIFKKLSSSHSSLKIE